MGTSNKAKKRILEVCTVPTERSGIPNVAFNLMRAMDHDRIEIGYVAINDPEESYKNELKKMGARLYVIPRKISSPWTYVWRLARAARGYDVMHVHGNSATMVLEMMAAWLAGVKVRAAHSHSTSCEMRTIDRYARPLFYALCNRRFACGEAAGEWLYGGKPFKVIKNGIDTEKFRFNPAKRKEMRSRLAPGGEFLIGNIANFFDVKNHAFLLEVFHEVVNNNPAVRLVLLGEGPLMEESRRIAADLGVIDKVYFLGSVSNPADYMQALDCIVMPSKYEGLPLTLVEEQANGLSDIVSDAVTRDADLTGNLTYLSLDAGAKEWAAEINRMIPVIKREAAVSDVAISAIRNAGFDINSSAAVLSQSLLADLK